MASKKQVLSNYTKKNLPKYEQEYAERTGTLAGFRKSPEYARFKRNRKSAEYRYNAKKRNEAIVKEIDKIEIDILVKGENTPEPEYSIEINEESVGDKIENFVVVEDGKPYFMVLSYGNEQDKAAIEYYKISRKLGNGHVTAYIDTVELNGEKKTVTSLFDYQIAIMELYKLCREMQTKYNAYPTITVATATVNGRETIWVKAQNEITWQKPKAKKKSQNSKR